MANLSVFQGVELIFLSSYFVLYFWYYSRYRTKFELTLTGTRYNLDDDDDIS